jgi:hypothetical protein
MLSGGLPSFLESRFGIDIPSIASIPVIVGSANCAYATTCGMYLEQEWGDCGNFYLSTMQDLVADIKKTPRVNTGKILGTYVSQNLRIHQ